MGRNHPSLDGAISVFLGRFEAHPLRPQSWRCSQAESDLTTRAWGRPSCDSTWEAAEAFELERNENAVAWAKNDHFGFEILYVYKGVVHKFRPDFLMRLTNGMMLVLEVKGQDTQQNKAKRKSLDEWVQVEVSSIALGPPCRPSSRRGGSRLHALRMLAYYGLHCVSNGSLKPLKVEMLGDLGLST